MGQRKFADYSMSLGKAHMKKWIFALSFLLVGSVQASVVTTHRAAGGWQLLVDGQPYIIHGMGYNSTATGQDPNVCSRVVYPSSAVYFSGYWDWMIQTQDHTVPSTNTVIGPYLAYNDQSRINQQQAYETAPYGALVGDFAFMKDMNVNTIRIYTHASSATAIMSLYAGACEGELLSNHAPNHAILADMFNTYGIRFAIGDETGAYAGDGIGYPGPTDYRDPVVRSSITASVRQMVTDFKSDPGLLMYVLGNENNYDFTLTNANLYPATYYAFVDQLAVMIHGLDPNHPVAIANGEVNFVDYFSSYCPHVDIFGLNAYRNPGGFDGFDIMWQQIADQVNRPVVLTEYGLFYPHILNPGGAVSNDSIVDGNWDAAVRQNYWCDIQNHAYGYNSSGLMPQNAIGGFNYEWLDEWWQAGNSNAFTITATGDPNAGAQGIAAQGAGINSPYARQFRPAYNMYKRIWSPSASCECQNGP